MNDAPPHPFGPAAGDVYTVVETIYSGTSTCITRARCGENLYIVKSNFKLLQNKKKLYKYFKEYSIGLSIRSPYVIRYIDFKRLGYGFAIIMDDIGGKRLKSVIPREGFPIDTFLQIACRIVQGLDAVHSAGVMHKDINPMNIVVNLDTMALNIIDFGLSSQMHTNEVPPKPSPTNMQGTLMYMSPEQTGRMNRVVDFRTDFYSLGVTFYEMLTGEPPFPHSVDPLDLIYKHMAVFPKHLIEVRPEVDMPISDIVGKLLSKNAEDRYQDCKGLMADLKEVLRARKQEVPLVDFVAGVHDQLRKLHVSQKLYGRDEEVKRLTHNFELACEGSPHASTLVLVHGYSGVGKTVLVHEVHKPLARRYGYYVSGKFDQFNTAGPFSALIQAIQQLLQQILTESEEQVLNWKQRILKGLGNNGQIVIGIIPELELIIGTQPDVANVGAVETLHRAKQVMSTFVFSLACKEHPLVIFLDDLQWADSNTLALLVDLLDPQSRNMSDYLLIVGAYRDNEVDATHALSLTLGEVNRKGGKVEDIPLLPLSEAHVIQLVEDTFNTNIKSSHKIDAFTLGCLVFKKTQGNPFFVNQLLVKLHKDGHIYPVEGKASIIDLENLEEGGWECNMKAIHEANYTSNAVDLMVAALQTLDLDAQRMIGMAATIGNQFNLALLARLCDMPELDVAVALHPAVRGGFLISNAEVGTAIYGADPEEMVLLNAPVAGVEKSTSLSRASFAAVYRFVHDRVQQAAAILLSPEDTLKTHVKLAEQLLQMSALSNDKDFSQNLLFIVNHMNLGFTKEQPPTREVIQRKTHTVAALSTSYLPFSVYTVASLNLLAATKARDANAYHQARQYADAGIALLEKDVDAAWRDQYSLCMGLYSVRAMLQTLTGSFTDPPCEELLLRAKTPLEKSEVYILLHDRHEAESNMTGALKMVFYGLRLLGIDLPENPEDQKSEFLEDIRILNERVGKLPHISHLANLPDCKDPIQLNIFKLLSITWLSAYMMGLEYLAGIICSHIVIRSMDHGLSAECGKAMVVYVIHGLKFYSDYAFLNQLALTGLRILDSRYPHHKALRGEANLMYGLGIAVWVYPLSECLQYIEAGFQYNKQAGNILWGTYGAFYFFEYPLMFGMNLRNVVHEYEKYLHSFWKAEAEKFGMYNFMEVTALPLWEFLGIERDVLKGERYEDSIFAKIPLYNAQFNFTKMFSQFILGNRKNLLQYTDMATELVPVCFVGLFRVAETETVAGLVFLDWVSRLPVAYELYGNRKRKLRPRHLVQGDDDDIASEPGDKETQLANLKKRLAQIEFNIKHLTAMTSHCEANFYHKALILRAELARVAIMFQSNAIYSVVKVEVDDPMFNVGGLSDSDDEDERSPKRRDFEEAMMLYEAAIESARQHGFQQYEAKCLELYGQFWLTAPTKPKEQFAYIYFSEAIVVYERWGATEKAALLRKKCATLAPYDSLRANSKPRRKKNSTVSSIDLDVIVHASQTISNEVDFDTLVIKMIKAIVENASAQKGTFFLAEGENESPRTKLWVCAEYAYEPRSTPKRGRDGEYCAEKTESPLMNCITLLQPRVALAEWKNGPLTVINYVRRTLQPIVLQCASEDLQFGEDEYIVSKKAKSVVCMPILLKNTLKGVMYLENNLCDGLYDISHVDLLKVLTSQMAISLENIRFLHDQMEKQSEQLRFEQLQKEEKLQRDRADAAEKYKIQLENFIDMICHEIRNPLNGIFGNTDLMFYYLEAIDEILQNYKFTKSPSSSSSSTSSLSSSPPATPTTSPMLNTILKIATKAPDTPRRGSNADTKLSLSSNLDKKSGEEALAYLLEQVMESTKTIQKCADHQKCMTDDVLQLSRLRSNKLTITNTLYRPFDTAMTAVTIFKPQVETKELHFNLQAEESCKNLEVLGDPVRIYQILSNFLSNALKFTHTGGLTIFLSIIDTPPSKKERVPDVTERRTSLSLDPRTSLGSSTIISPPSSSPAFPFTNATPVASPTLNSRTQPASPNLEVPNREYVDSTLTLGVYDTGIGMSVKEQARIFKRFSQANNRTAQEYGGTGLGLAICRKLAKLMKGSITLQSDKGTGSSFTLTVPCKRALPLAYPPSVPLSPTSAVPMDTSAAIPNTALTATASHGSEAAASPSLPSHTPASLPPAKPPKKILIVEDNIVNQAVLSRVLKIKGYLVEIANNGAEGFERFRTSGLASAWFDVVLMDLQMPVMDGLTCTDLIRKFEIEMGRTPAIIIGLSGNARDEYRHTALAAGMNEYITKPYHKEVLYDLLESGAKAT